MELNNEELISMLCDSADKLDKFGFQDIASDIDKALLFIAQ